MTQFVTDFSPEDVDAFLGEESTLIEEKTVELKDLFAIEGVSGYLVRAINRVNKKLSKIDNMEKISQWKDLAGVEAIEKMMEFMFEDEANAFSELVDHDVFFIDLATKAVLVRSRLGKS